MTDSAQLHGFANRARKNPRAWHLAKRGTLWPLWVSDSATGHSLAKRRFDVRHQMEADRPNCRRQRLTRHVSPYDPVDQHVEYWSNRRSEVRIPSGAHGSRVSPGRPGNLPAECRGPWAYLDSILAGVSKYDADDIAKAIERRPVATNLMAIG